MKPSVVVNVVVAATSPVVEVNVGVVMGVVNSFVVVASTSPVVEVNVGGALEEVGMVTTADSAMEQPSHMTHVVT